MQINQKTHITSTSNDGLIFSGRCRIVGVSVNTEASTQTLSLYDAATEAAAAAGNLFAVIKLDTRGLPFDFFGAQCQDGLVAILSGGSPDLTVIWG